MVYTEIKERNGKKYFYRVLSFREGKKVSKSREYLGANLSKTELSFKEKEADINFELIFKKLNRKKKKEIDNKLKSEIRDILIKNKIKRAGIFGSYARGDFRKDSDIDILIEPSEGMGFGFAGLEIQLSDKLKKKIDLITYNGLSPYLKEKILDEEVRII